MTEDKYKFTEGPPIYLKISVYVYILCHHHEFSVGSSEQRQRRIEYWLLL
jgi:hypothetical protein